MKEGDILTSLLAELNTLFRYVYPGLVLVGFIIWRSYSYYSKWSHNGVFYFLAVVGILVIGILFHPFYRVLYDNIIRRIERWCKCMYPQYRFHKSVLDELKKEGAGISDEVYKKLKSMQVATAIHANIITAAPLHFTTSFSRFNSTVHVLFMSSLLSLIILFIDVPYYHNCYPWLFIWFGAFVLLFIAGLFLDKQADLRETMYLVKNKDEYKEILRKYIPYAS